MHRVPQDLRRCGACPCRASRRRRPTIGHADRLGRLVDHGDGRRRCGRGRCRRSSPATARSRAVATLPALTSAASCSVLRDVVVEDGAALGVEVEARARHVALDGGDGRGAVLGLVADQRPGGEGARDRERGRLSSAAAAAAAAASGRCRRHARTRRTPRTGRSRTGRPRSRAPGCRRPRRAAGRRRRPGRRRSCPRGSRRTGTRARAASPAIHTAGRPQRPAGQLRHGGDAERRRARRRAPRPTTSAIQGPGPTSAPVHTSSGSRKPRPER